MDEMHVVRHKEKSRHLANFGWTGWTGGRDAYVVRHKKKSRNVANLGWTGWTGGRDACGTS